MPQGPMMGIDDHNVQRDLGKVEARTAILERRMDNVEERIETTLAQIFAQLRVMQTAIDRGTGGRQALAWTAGILGGLAALLTVLYHIGAVH